MKHIAPISRNPFAPARADLTLLGARALISLFTDFFVMLGTASSVFKKEPTPDMGDDGHDDDGGDDDHLH